MLALLGIALTAFAVRMARWQVLPDHPQAYAIILLAQLSIYGLAVGWVIRRKPDARWALAIIILVALAARLAFLTQTPEASDDIYRYVWDGRIQAHGINPYRYVPSDPALERYQDEAIYSHVNRKGVPTIYPPVAQGVFHLVFRLHPNSVAWTKLVFIATDLVTIGVIIVLLVRLGLGPERSVLYAWHPLLILELGHSGHVDVLVILCLVLAVWARFRVSPLWTGIFLALATLIKFYAVVALPALLYCERRRDLHTLVAFAMTALLAYLPFLSVGSGVLGYLPGYAQEEGIITGQRFYLLQQAERFAGSWPPGWSQWLAGGPLSATQWYQAVMVSVMGVLGLWCWLRPPRSERDIAGRVAILFIALLTLASPSQAWYTLLPLVLVPLVRGRSLLSVSMVVGTAGFVYLHWWWPGAPSWPLTVAYGGRAVALGLVGVCSIHPMLSRYVRSRWPIPFRRTPYDTGHVTP